jgi:glycosyltransferase involved in cell wall biosynthesis
MVATVPPTVRAGKRNRYDMPSKRLYSLAAHDPTRDPRIDWVARFATDQFEVTTFGIAEKGRPAPASETVHGYRIVRLTKTLQGFRTIVPPCARWVLTSWLLSLMAPAALCFLPLLWVSDTIRVVRKALRRVFGAIVPRRIRNPIQEPITAVLTWIGPSRTAYRLLAFLRLDQPIWLARYFIATTVTLYREVGKAAKPDLIYCNDLDTLLAGVLLKFHFHCKLIYDAHEFWPCADPSFPWWQVKLFLLYESKLLPHVDAAFTVNQMLAAQMQRALGRSFGSVPNCEPIHAADLKPPMPTSAFTSVRLAQGRVRFLFQGNFAPERGILELLSAWARVDHDRAVLFLRGPDNEYRRECVELAQQLGILDKAAYFLDQGAEADLVAGAAEADVGVIPYKAVTINYRYCCPNKLSQYMQAGLAILANDLDYIKSVIERYQCGLTYDVNDETSIVSAIHRFIDDERFRRHCQRQARLMAIREYNWETISRPLYETCARLAGCDRVASANKEMSARRAA